MALGFAASPAAAEWLTGVTTNGVNIAYWLLNQSDCTLDKSLTPPDQEGLQELLRGSNSECVPNQSPGPGGNIELGDVDSEVWKNVSSLEGNICGGRIRLSSLTKADWEAEVKPGVRLADQYVLDGIEANCGVRPPLNFKFQVTGDPTLQQVITACFIDTNGLCPGNLSLPPAQRASDPNVAYVRSNSDGSVSIGLAGNFDTSDLLPAAFDCAIFGGVQKDPPQASEVVKFQVLGGPPAQYLYSFEAAPSGITAEDVTAILRWHLSHSSRACTASPGVSRADTDSGCSNSGPLHDPGWVCVRGYSLVAAPLRKKRITGRGVRP